MNRELVDRIADAVLYEGYILYPYRPSVKNRSRWTFGGLYPPAYCQEPGSSDAASNQAECLVCGTSATLFDATVRFLHLTARLVGEFAPPRLEWSDGAEGSCRRVEALRVGDRLYQEWQEAEECEVDLGAVTLGDLSVRPQCRAFAFPGGRKCEPIRGPDGAVVGALVREQQAIRGNLEAAAAELEPGLFRVTLRVANQTPLEGGGGRDQALLRTLVSTHAILGVRQGEFVSLLDPPERWREAAAACRNIGTWPVLAGAEGEKDTMLSSPIILYDYPRVAPESPGDFFDATEIDEMLTLRILTLTDEEKGAMAAVDDRARALLARTEAMAGEQRPGLHGAIRDLRTLPEGDAHG
jgi:hydrogenase maturation protease